MVLRKLDKIKVQTNGVPNYGIIIGFKDDEKLNIEKAIFVFSSNGFIGESAVDNIEKIGSLVTPAKYLTKILRHDPEDLKMDNQGYILVNDVLKKFDLTRAELQVIVDQDNKGRFVYSKDKEKIRAAQGHSIKGLTIEMDKVHNKEVTLYHGTSKSNYEKIKEAGQLIPMSRQYVHWSGDVETAEKVGLRHAKNKKDLIILYVKSEDLFNLDINISISENGVYQTGPIPVEVLKILR